MKKLIKIDAHSRSIPTNFIVHIQGRSQGTGHGEIVHVVKTVLVKSSNQVRYWGGGREASSSTFAPDYLRSMFVNRSIVTNSLRDTEGKLATPKPRTDYLRNSFSYSSAVLWNSLPTDLRQTENPNQFKAGCINFFYQ